MTKFKRILSNSAGLSLLILLFVGNLLGILTDKQEDARQYYMEAGNVGIDLAVDNGNSDDTVLIQPNAVTPLSINVTNTGSKDCYVFIKLIIPELSGHPILSISPTGNWQMVEELFCPVAASECLARK